MVVAKHDRAHRRRSPAQFTRRTRSSGSTRRVVWGVPGAARGHDRPRRSAAHPHDRKRMAVVRAGGKRAVTHWRLLDGRRRRAPLGSSVALRDRPHPPDPRPPRRASATRSSATGSTAAAGQAPRRRRRRDAVAASTGILLHARRLGFIHPVTGRALRVRRAAAGRASTAILATPARLR